MKSSIGLFYQLTVTDKNGKVVRKTRLRKSKSFVIGFLKLMQNAMGQTATVDIKDIDGATNAYAVHINNFSCASAIGFLTYGIVLGTGTTPPASVDYVMETLIAHGNAATELSYAAMSFIDAQVVGPNCDFQAIRAMVNNSGGTINVTEAGLYGRRSTDKYIMLIHDVFTAVPVLDTETITVTYTLRTTV